MLTAETIQWLRAHYPETLRLNESMWHHTSLRVGGPADAWVAPAGIEALRKLLRWCHQRQIPFMVIGSGTNLLVTDRGIRGIVISLKHFADDIHIEKTEDLAVRITAMAGVRLSALCRLALHHQLTGLNFALGIPGTLGGAVRMNAGTHLGTMADILEFIDVVGPEGKTWHIPRQALNVAYRRLSWSTDVIPVPPGEALIVKAGLNLQATPLRHARQKAHQIVQKRRARQPWHACSAGCFFKNPPVGKTAGELIDLAGFKGRRWGTAQVSERHANFIINTTGGRTSPGCATDILQLIHSIQKSVFEQFNIHLETEVKIAGILPEKNAQ
jgi:UDP-N-acetylmuramate dehydrogenase